MAALQSVMLVYIIAALGSVVLGGIGVWYTVQVYNELVGLQERIDQAQQNIDVLQTQRQDELNSLIEAADSFLDHEQDLLEELTEAREASAQAETVSEQAVADQHVRNALSEFTTRTESYPVVQSQHTITQVQDRIIKIERQISARREHYNEAVTRYNTKIERVPYVIIAELFNYERAELFAAPDSVTERVDVGVELAPTVR